MRVVAVLRSGGEYAAAHVQRLQQQLPVPLTVLSDVDVPGVTRIPLVTDLPGWWAKIELLRQDLSGDFLFFDLDTTIVGDLTDILAVRRLTLLRDFYRNGHALQSSVMFLPEADRHEAWNAWHNGLPAIYGRKGDQAFFEDLWQHRADRWQDVLPGQFVSFKVHCRRTRRAPHGAKVVVYHGKPRPWALEGKLL